MKKTYIALLAIVITPFALGACSGAKEQLGLERSVPDEFAVVKRAPLEMPPSYYLRPPAPGTPRRKSKQRMYKPARPYLEPAKNNNQRNLWSAERQAANLYCYNRRGLASQTLPFALKLIRKPQR